jgi:hypothetical protein
MQTLAVTRPPELPQRRSPGRCPPPRRRDRSHPRSTPAALRSHRTRSQLQRHRLSKNRVPIACGPQAFRCQGSRYPLAGNGPFSEPQLCRHRRFWFRVARKRIGEGPVTLEGDEISPRASTSVSILATGFELAIGASTALNTLCVDASIEAGMTQSTGGLPFALGSLVASPSGSQPEFGPIAGPAPMHR